MRIHTHARARMAAKLVHVGELCLESLPCQHPNCLFDDGSMHTLSQTALLAEMLRAGLDGFPFWAVQHVFGSVWSLEPAADAAYRAFCSAALAKPSAYATASAISDTSREEATATRKRAMRFNGAQRALWPAQPGAPAIGRAGELFMLEAIVIGRPRWFACEIAVNGTVLGTYFEYACTDASRIELGPGITLAGGTAVSVSLCFIVAGEETAWDVFACTVHEPVSSHLAQAANRRSCDSMYWAHCRTTTAADDMAVRLLLPSPTATAVYVSGPHWRGISRIPKAALCEKTYMDVGDAKALMFGVRGPLTAVAENEALPCAYWIVQRVLKAEFTIEPCKQLDLC